MRKAVEMEQVQKVGKTFLAFLLAFMLAWGGVSPYL